MLNHPEINIYLWLLPLILFLLVPLSMTMGGRIGKLSNRVIAIFTGQSSHTEIPSTRDREKDKRRHPRIKIASTTISVTDGCIFSTAVVENISEFGICLKDLPEPLYKNADILTIFSNDDKTIPTLRIKPKWERTVERRGKTIGAAIVEISDEWSSFFENSGKLATPVTA